MPKQIEAWQCDYCKKRYASKPNARRHEKTCIFNPDCKACITCEHSFYKAPDADPGCKIGKIGPGGRWIKGCHIHKYQGCIGIDMDEDFGEGYTYEDLKRDDY